MVWATVFSYRNLPLIETTPFRAGVNIPEAMAVPDDAEPDRYTTELHYRDRATGKVHIFSEKDTTWWDDSRWEFVETKTILVQKGFRPAIENFKLLTGEVVELIAVAAHKMREHRAWNKCSLAA